MFKRLLIAVCAATVASAAFAADVAAPAAPFANLIKGSSVPSCQVATTTTPLSCSGTYVGIGLAGQGSNADIVGSGINGSVFAGGMTPGLDVGYQYVQGNWLVGAEYDLGYSINNGVKVNAVGGNFDGIRSAIVFKAGGNLAGLLGTQAPITIPPQLANAVLAPYVHVDPTFWQIAGTWATGTGSGAGVLFDFGPRIFGDLRYTYTDFHGAKGLSGATIQNDQSLRFSVNYKLN